jgi:hypothetical protein
MGAFAEKGAGYHLKTVADSSLLVAGRWAGIRDQITNKYGGEIEESERIQESGNF